MTARKLILIAIIIFFQANAGWTSENSGVAFLKIGVGARPMGMGGAFCAVADDASGLYWNPAGLAQIEGQEFTLMHNQWFCGINQEYLGWVTSYGESKTKDYPKPPTGIKTIGGCLSYLYIGGIPGCDVNGQPTRDFSAYDLNFTLCYSQEVTAHLLSGANLKFISQTNEEESASVAALDVGWLYRIAAGKLNLGLALQNIGSKIKFIDQGNPLPLAIKAGLAIRPSPRLTFALDEHIPIYSQSTCYGGLEFYLLEALALRAGYKSRTDLDFSSHWSYGFGLKINDYQLDYAFGTYGILGDSQRVSFSVKYR